MSDLIVDVEYVAPGDEQLYWIDPSGLETRLSQAANYEVEWGVQGRFMPPIRTIADDVPEQPGQRLRSVLHGPREVELPITFMHTSQTGLRATLREVLGLFNPTRGDGTLKVVAPGGDTRELTCRYKNGLQGNESKENGIYWQKAMVVLEASDPYWYDTTATEQSFLLTDSGPTFFPFFPLRLSASELFSEATVTNTGDVDAWPVWTITGPGADPIITNVTTGDVLELNCTLSSGDELVIDTRPNHKTIMLGSENVYRYLVAGAELFTLIAGGNDIQIDMGSATDDSSVDLSYYRRYLGA